MKPILEKLTEGGWLKVTDFGFCEIYSKNEERILYDPKTDEIIKKYKSKDENEY